ncbi:Protein CBG25644 [Caenorhabditis briggsae]|uniref:Protein CBG25644 n=1 Tax=Caenorhabditis briggsae TaxID=6238 RepID=B6IFC8_CAEBR|nr:Protein CBG25644 [Caenorhabditis briggsae]CAR98608.1 Protein CBG25644 [Caenorhabditis briggsae]
MIGKIRSVLLKKSETKSLNSKPNLEEVIEKHRN